MVSLGTQVVLIPMIEPCGTHVPVLGMFLPVNSEILQPHALEKAHINKKTVVGLGFFVEVLSLRGLTRAIAWTPLPTRQSHHGVFGRQHNDVAHWECARRLHH